jgi:hypothetical protein
MGLSTAHRAKNSSSSQKKVKKSSMTKKIRDVKRLLSKVCFGLFLLAWRLYIIARGCAILKVLVTCVVFTGYSGS